MCPVIQVPVEVHDPVASPESPAPESVHVDLSSVTGTQVMSGIAEADQNPRGGDKEKTKEKTIKTLVEVAGQVGKVYDFSTLSEFVSDASAGFQRSCVPPPTVHDNRWSWDQHYTVLSFLLNGHLRAEYVRRLGLPPCSKSQWQCILGRLEPHVTKLAEWSCGQVQQQIVERGDKKQCMGCII